MRLRIGTRGSALALAQARWVESRLRALRPGLETELAVIKTAGDALSERGAPPPAPAAGAANVKALFVKEIEAALLEGSIDAAVHSAKDLPAELPEPLSIAAYPEREDPRDVFIGAKGLRELAVGARIGTTSLRRRIQLAIARPDVEFVPMAGNVDTRLKRLAAGAVDGLVLAAAGLARLGLSGRARETLDPELVVPAPGQGALAVEARRDRREVMGLLAGLDDPAARVEVELERSFVRRLGGGCATPLGALARAEGGAGVEFTVFWSDPDGGRPTRLKGRAGRRPEELDSLVEGLAGRLLG